MSWGAFHVQPAVGLKARERFLSRDAEEYGSRVIIQLDLVGDCGPQVKGNRLDSSPQIRPLSWDEHGDLGGVHLAGWTRALYPWSTSIYVETRKSNLVSRVSGLIRWESAEFPSPVTLDRVSHVTDSDAGRMYERLKAANPYQ